MNNWKESLVFETQSIRSTIEVIDKDALQIALVVNKEDILLGTVTDGDVRRGILKGLNLDEPVTQVMCRNPIVTNEDASQEQILSLMEEKNIRHMPVIDQAGKVVGLKVLLEMLTGSRNDNLVVIMAGGLGSRLGELTKQTPKPMLKIGKKPIIETILNNFILHGFYRFCFAVNYKAEVLEQYFGNGENWGVDIKYVKESKRLGTAGALGLLGEKENRPVIVMNGDILTKINFRKLLEFHVKQNAVATMCVLEYDFEVPYGVVEIQEQEIRGIVEKPIHYFFVNGGIYILEPTALSYIPKNHYLDMPELFRKLIDKKKKTSVFPIREYWLDIGDKKEFERAYSDIGMFES
jgi:dTDP-glucose pyrophosphorylase